MLGELNVNRLLESSRRSDVIGYNIYTFGKVDIRRPDSALPIIKQWDDASLGLCGTVAIGFELNVKDLIVPKLSANGTPIVLYPVRNRWTPAFMDTYYRAKAFGEYKKSGLIAVRERKCFTEDDTFISHLTFFNDSREPISINFTLSLPFERICDGLYAAKARIVPAGLQQKLNLDGFAAAYSELGDNATLTVPAQSNVSLRYGLAFSPDSAQNARDRLDAALKKADPFAESEANVNGWMSKHAPKLKIDDTDLQKIYYYRFFLIKSAIHTPTAVLPNCNFKGECVYESPFGGWFGAPIGLPIPMQIEEMKWMRDTTAVRSAIANWCRGVGTTQGYIQFTPMAIWELYLKCADTSLIAECYDAVKAYTAKKMTSGDNSLPLCEGSWVTGAEYQPAFYQHTEPQWDWRHDSECIAQGFSLTSLHRVDECVMHAANLLACKNMAKLLGKDDDAKAFSANFDSTIERIEALYDKQKEFFFDLDVKSQKSCDEAYGYDGFMPTMFSLLGEKYHAVFKQLDKNARFDGGFGTTTVGKDCPMYWFDNCIAGPVASSVGEPHSYGCSWNGPIWPYAMSLVLEALGSATNKDASLSDTFERLFYEYTELHFVGGDRSTPCIFEHYRPSDANSFSPYRDYFHSEWLNLFFSYLLGVRITKDGMEFSPLTKREFIVEGLTVKGKQYRLSQTFKDGELCRESQCISGDNAR